MSAALARAITDSEDEGGAPSLPITPRRAPPTQSRAPVTSRGGDTTPPYHSDDGETLGVYI